MRLKLIISLIILIILIIICSYIFIGQNNYIINYKNNSSSNTSNVIITPNPTSSTDQNNSLIYPPNDFVINHINWSSYPNLETGYIYTVYVAEPTNVVPHKFIEVQILTEVKGIDNITEIRRQLSGVAQEARKIYGYNSDINIHGTKDGASAWIVSMLPNDDTIY